MGRFLFSVCEDLEMGTWKWVSCNRMELDVSESFKLSFVLFMGLVDSLRTSMAYM